MDPIATGGTANLSSEAAKGIFNEAKRHIRYVRIYKRNVDKFEEKHKMLMAKRAGVQQEVDAAKRNVEKIKADVEDWCDRVDKKIQEEEKKVKELDDKAKNKCFMGLCPNIKCRYQLSRKAEEGANAVDELLREGQLINRVSYRDVPKDIVDGPPKDFEAFKSREKVFNDIMEALKDSTIGMIGVYGMPGVGKTMLVNEVARQAKNEKLFDAVVMGVVSQTPDVQKIQNEIADSLGLKFKEQSEIGRARRLCERLKKEKILVVLDDLWAGLDLNQVGIPLNDPEKRTDENKGRHIKLPSRDRNVLPNEMDAQKNFQIGVLKEKEAWELPLSDPEKRTKENKGCHILLTSRDRNVLTNEMDAQKNFQIGVLEEKEAWELFKKMAGDTAESPELRSTATEVARECGGLPLAIATIARALRNQGLFAWNDALRTLQRPSPTNYRGIPQRVYSAIEFSYNHLGSEELRQTFLLFSLLGHHAYIQDLLKYSIGLSLFHGVNTVEEARDRLLTVVSDLKASSLLHDSHSPNWAGLHDLICNVGLVIASKDNNVFALKHDDVLPDWPDLERMKMLNKINLDNASISLPEGLHCPQLTFFHMHSKDLNVEMPSKFFMEMKNLKVLDLTKMRFSSLPSSVSVITNLRTLCLDQCVLEDIALIGELKNLEILSLLKSDIKMLPMEIGQLIRLRLFDLGGCTKLKIIPPGVLSSLSRLEELYMGDSFVEWEVERHANQQTKATLAELKLLSRLTTLEIHIPDPKIIPGDLFFEKLKRYKIFIGKAWDWVGVDEYSRTLRLQLDRSIHHHLDDGINMLLKKTEDLHLDDMKGAKVALHGLMDEEGFQHLKKVHIQNCLDMQYIIDDNGAVDSKEFLQLQSLTLQSLPQLVSFSCKNQRSSTSGSQHELPLFGEKILFPCLKNLCLSSINVERIWSDRPISNKSFYNHENLTSLIVEGCGNLKWLLSSSMARSLVNLECLEIVECKCLREIIFSEEDDIEEEVVLFPQLNSLELKKLPHLMGFCSEDHKIEFPSLKLLVMWHCPRLKGFMYKSEMEDNQLSPQALFNEMVAFPSLEKLKIVHLRNLKVIWFNQLSGDSFCKLTEMTVENCTELSKLFPCDMWSTFQRLQILKVSSCGSLEEIFEVQSLNSEETHVVATQLRELHIRDLPKLKRVWSMDPQGILTFQNLSVVQVWDCWNLKNVFPASTARFLPQLKDLEIGRCGVEEIVSKDEGWDKRISFEFDQLSSLTLWSLPELKCFYSGVHTIEWPVLKLLSAWHCNKVKIFDTDMNDYADDGQLQQHPPLFSIDKVITKLEEVCLKSDEIAMISDNSKFSRCHFRNIKALRVFCYHDKSAIFPVTFLERFNNLEKLEFGCCRFKELFSYEGGFSMEINAGRVLPCKSLTLNGLENLERIWKEESRLDHFLPNLETLEVVFCGSLISLGSSLAPFQNLVTLSVSYCDAMINLVISSSAVHSLVQLKILKIRDCKSMKEVVGNEGSQATDRIFFNRLKCMELRNLPSLKGFCSGNHAFIFPSLEQVVVINCPEMEFFCEGVSSAPMLQTGEDLNSTVKQLYTNKVGYQGVEYLLLSDSSSRSIDIWKQNLLDTNLDFSNLKTLEVKECSSLTYIFTTSMALSVVQLKEIKVINCPVVEQVIRNEGTEEPAISRIKLPRLEFIVLESCSNLTSFFLGSNIMECPSLQKVFVIDCPKMFEFISAFPRKQDMKSIGGVNAPFFNDKMLFPCLEMLRLSSINVERIWQQQFSNKSFCALENLTILIIRGCGNLKQLLSSSMARGLVNLKRFEIHECKCLREIIFSEEDDMEEEVVLFPQLNLLELRNLPHLMGFCSEDHKVNFPSLKLLEMWHCPTLKGFMYKCKMEDNLLCPQALFNGMAAFPSLEKLKIVHLRNLKMIWHNQLSGDSFCKLTEMAIENCAELSKLFPCDMWSTLQRLQILKVSSCCSLEEIFELQNLNMEEAHVVATQFRELNINDLPKLKHVWNKDPQGILTFQNLSAVRVWDCGSLKNVFPASIARCLPQLKDLLIARCGVEEIVSKEEGWDTRISFEFDQLSSLMIWDLPELKCFYSGMHTIEWPMLKEFNTWHCNKVKIFDMDMNDYADDCQLQRPPPLFSIDKVITKLEEVCLNSDDIAMISGNSKFSRCHFRNIKALKVLCYHDESAIFPVTFLERFNNLEKLEFGCCRFKELFSYKGGFSTEINAGRVLPCKSLRLNGLQNLERVWEESRLDQFLPNLETLDVVLCGSLISLGSSLAPFQNLVTLSVSDCDAMINLVTSSSAVHCLVQLKILKIGDCKSMKEVVGNDGSQATDDIIFNRLKCMELRNLPSLKSFCLGNHAFIFPSLEQVVMINCPEMETFCEGVSSAPMLQRGQDLNSIVKQLYTKKVGYQGVEYLLLSDTSSRSIDIWKQNLLDTDLDFSNLKILEVKDCSSLTFIFTPSMALSLVQLKEIKVINCPVMEQIIRNERTEEATISLIKLTRLEFILLESCSNLTSFCLGSNIMECPSLQNVFVIDCPNMFEFMSAFPRKHDMESIGGLNASFFNDKMVFLCLERLRLSSINVERIWQQQFSNKSFCTLENLTILIITGCGNLKQLLSSSMARTLVNLKCFEIHKCKCLREIIFTEEDDIEEVVLFPQLNSLELKNLPYLTEFCSKDHKSKMEDNQLSSQALFNEMVAFPSLKKLEIVHLRNLKMIWHNQLSGDSFCKLTEMAVENCTELSKLFPCDMWNTFQRLQILKVSGCGSLEEIFEVRSLNSEETHVVPTQLRELHIHDLPKLKRVWSKDPQGNLTFQNLSVVQVWDCWNLRNVFPASTARFLPQLKDLEIGRCGVEEIVSKEEGSDTMISFEFDQLSSLTLWDLPQLKCLFPGLHTTMWPAFKRLKARHCTKVKIFGIDMNDYANDGQQDSPIQRHPPLFLFETVITKLEEVCLNSDDIAMISDGDKFSNGHFGEVKTLRVHCYHDECAVIPVTLLERFNNLEKLEIGCCEFKELFSYDGGFGKEINVAGTVLPIKSLTLNSLHNVKYIWKLESGLERFLPRLETLEVIDCENLISLGSSSAPLPNLMTLVVSDCKAMINLVTSSSEVQSLVQLKNLKIRDCAAMKEVVGSEGSQATDGVIFNRLECIELRNLPRLKSICSGDQMFTAPSLRISVGQCPEMEFFFRKGDLDGNQPVGYRGVKYLILSDSFRSIDIWKKNRQESLDLTNLRVLEVKDCSSLTYIFTTSMALNLVQLKEIKVNNCPMLEQIIRNEGAEEAALISMIMLSRLESITLESCSSLTSFSLGSNALECPSLRRMIAVDCPKMFEFTSTFPRKQDMGRIDEVNAPFFNDKVLCPNLQHLELSSVNIQRIWPDQTQVTSYNVQNLKSFVVQGCHSLRYILPSSLCEKLAQLNQLEIYDCTNVEEVICTERLTTETQTDLIEAEPTTNFVFPEIRSLVLKKLPKLKCFYSKIHIIEWPLLKGLQVIGCNKVETLVREFLERTGKSQPEIFQQPLFWVNEDSFTNLEGLHLEENGIMEEIWHGQLPTKYFPKLNWLKLIGFSKNAVAVPNCFIQSLPNLEKLQVSESSFNEIFQSEGLGVGAEEEHLGALTRLKELRLSQLPELRHIWKEEIPLGETFSNLRILEVLGCAKLENALVPPLVSFKNLTTLEVSKCHGLKNLLTLPTARSMMLLERMSVIDCQMMKEIIASTSNEVMDGIVFSKLKSLELGSLPSLSRFCSGNYTFGFPSLEKLIMKQCPKMESFSEGELSTPMLQGVQSTEGEYVGCWEGDLNAIIRLLFVEKVFPGMEDLQQSLVNIQRIWHWKLQAASSYAQNLTCLTVEGCPNLKCLFSSSMMESFAQLKMLHIDNCENVETVIFMEGLGEGQLMSQTSFRVLESLLIKDLPKLTRFCHGSYIEFPLLRFLRVQSCLPLKTTISKSVMGNTFQIDQEAEGNNLEIASPALLGEKVAFPCLEELGITVGGKWKEIWHDRATDCVTIHFAS